MRVLIAYAHLIVAFLVMLLFHKIFDGYDMVQTVIAGIVFLIVLVALCISGYGLWQAWLGFIGV